MNFSYISLFPYHFLKIQIFRSHFGSSRTLRPAGSICLWGFWPKLSLFVRLRTCISISSHFSLPWRPAVSSGGPLEHITPAEPVIIDTGRSIHSSRTVFGPEARLIRLGFIFRSTTWTTGLTRCQAGWIDSGVFSTSAHIFV